MKNNKAEFDFLMNGQMEVPYENAVRTSPNVTDIEEMVLGAILIDNECFPDLIQLLNEKHFYKPAHSIIWKAMIRLWESSQPIDLTILREELIKSGDWKKIKGEEILTKIVSSESSSVNAKYHAQIIIDKWIKREMIRTSTQIISDSLDPTLDSLETLNTAERTILDISLSLSKKQITVVKDELDQIYSDLQLGIGAGVMTGYKELDKLTGGFQKSELIVLAGRPSHGKTALGLNIGRNVAAAGGNVAIFSLEMSVRELMVRLISSEARVDGKRLKLGKSYPEEWMRIKDAIPQLKTNIFIDDSSELSILEIRAKSRKIHKDNPLDLILVDYLQLIKGPADAERRDLEVAYISRNLKALAKELDVPVIACSQLNRNIENRGKEKRPQLSDLRESGAIEQDADVVIFIHRPIVGMKYDDKDKDMEQFKRQADIIIGKQRNGPTGDVKLVFMNEYTRFENMEYNPNIKELHTTEKSTPVEDLPF